MAQGPTARFPRAGYTVRGPVAWLSPVQLARTGIEVAQGTLFARFADKRDVEASTPERAYDLSGLVTGDEPFVLDYVADTGDGFDPTFAVAADLAHGAVSPDVGTKLLVFGGDLVYPVASVREYEDRLVGPYTEALADLVPGAASLIEPEPDDAPQGGAPYVVAIPGNHDWYDGLGAFRRMMCESWVKGTPKTSRGAFVMAPDELSSDRFATGWSAVQSRSYWAVQLPHGWWVWGIDIQLDAPIDAAQLAYFRLAATQLGPDSNLVVCTARPSWVDDDPQGAADYFQGNKQNLVWFLDRTLGTQHRHKARLLLSGDTHHYLHYALDGGRTPAGEPGVLKPDHLVTCGSGGAYLSSTHHTKRSLTMQWRPRRATQAAPPGPTVSYTSDEPYPSRSVSARLRWRFLRATWKNSVYFPLSLMTLYALVAPTAARGASQGWLPLPRAAQDSVVANPPSVVASWGTAAVVLALVVLGLGAYGNAKRERRPALLGWGLGLLHGLAHVAVATAAWALPHLLDLRGPGEGTGWFVWFLVHAAGVVAGGLAGTVVVAVYYVVADLLGMQHNDAFSGLQLTGYKGHLRLTVRPESLTVVFRHIDAVRVTRRRFAGPDALLAWPPRLVRRERLLTAQQVVDRFEERFVCVITPARATKG